VPHASLYASQDMRTVVYMPPYASQDHENSGVYALLYYPGYTPPGIYARVYTLGR